MVTVPYKCNRAVMSARGGLLEPARVTPLHTRVSYRSAPARRLRSFVSDQYHESLPFRFAPGYENRRVNLTLLFGDRWSQSLGAAAEPEHERERGGSVAAVADPAGDGWDVFG